MRRISLFALTLLFAAPAAAADYSAAPATARVPNCQVVLADEAYLSPREAGILKKVPVTPGKQVDAGQIVLQLDDTKARQELNVAKAKLHAAQVKASDTVNERYATAAAATAAKELEYNQKANIDVPKTVPKAKIEELVLKCKETELAIEKAVHERIVAEAEMGIAAAEVKAMETAIELLEVKSPISGEVVEVGVHEGEAVQPGQPGVLHIVGLDRLWVQGPVSASAVDRNQLTRQPVTVEFETSPGHKITAHGEVVFVSPLNDLGGTYQVRAEIRRDSREALLPFHPGMQGVVMTIPLKPAEAK
jgi:multidrug resistance efflux pump